MLTRIQFQSVLAKIHTASVFLEQLTVVHDEQGGAVEVVPILPLHPPQNNLQLLDQTTHYIPAEKQTIVKEGRQTIL